MCRWELCKVMQNGSHFGRTVILLLLLTRKSRPNERADRTGRAEFQKLETREIVPATNVCLDT
jgi:hypothetical protein